MDFLTGQTLLFDKPKGWTSFDVVKKVRSTIKIKKVGHAGTLDPLATGLLILCTGKHTKQIEAIQGQEKEYVVDFKLGATTASYDAEHPEENIRSCDHITTQEIQRAIQSFEGEIEQVPPVYSAVKVDGKRAYKAAREGKDIKLKSRIVSIYEFSYQYALEEPHTHRALVRCSKGTYIRSLVHDLGQQLGVGAYIRELRRTKIGNYHVDQAWDVLDFAKEYST